MDWYCLIAWAAVLAQLLFVYFAVRNYRYVVAKSTRDKRTPYRPRTALIIPCKGLDAHFDSNVRSFLEQDYDDYHLFFVVAEESDPAFAELRKWKERLKGPQTQENALGGPVAAASASSPIAPCVEGILPAIRGQDALDTARHAPDVQILVAGPSRSCGQKIHNLLYAVERVPDDTEVLAFADSDVCVHRDWLRRLVRPLWRPRCGVATGYRWFVPMQNNPASLALSAMNAAVAQFLGNSPFNQAWGGSMAVRMQDFRRLSIPEIWSNTLSDDLSLSRAVKRARMRVVFVPECLVASFESSTWPRLYEFARRQLLITRVYTPGAWWLGFLSSLGSVAGLWVGGALAAYAAATHAEHVLLYAAVPILFFAGQLIRAMLRQLAAARILKEHIPQLMPAALADILGCWLWSLVLLACLLASAFGRTIRWRGIRYKLLGPTKTVVLDAATDT
jgi:cellulose synthase/poly-beta-1,6-N-acetylglucosamine synthase-like glycosyltransferase